MMSKLLKFFEKKSLACVSFYQALGLVIYCSLIGLLMWRGNEIFGRVTNFWGPLLFLVLFVVSALISGAIVLGYPLVLFWEKKETQKAIKLVAFTTFWLAAFTFILMLGLIFL